jgi:hypothetical protein
MHNRALGHPHWPPTQPSATGSPSALCVQIELIADDVLVDAVGEMFPETISERQKQVIHAFFIQDSRQNTTRFSAVILSQKLADLLHGDIALKIQVEIFE